jgi:hypothetical protein
MEELGLYAVVPRAPASPPRASATRGVPFDDRHPPNAIIGRFRVSPDGRWLAFNDREAGAFRIIVVVPFLRTGGILPDRWIGITPDDAIVTRRA